MFSNFIVLMFENMTYKKILEGMLMKIAENEYDIEHNIANHETRITTLDTKVTTLEIVLFEFLKSSKHEKFKEVQALIK